jgi:hypothetical protein
VNTAPTRHSLAAVIFPLFDTAGAERIATLRKTYDPTPAIAIARHITLIFPTALLDEATLKAHVEAQARGIVPFDVVLRSAIAHRDRVGTRSLLYLLPRVGAERLSLLHDRLYGGLMMSELRRSEPYLAHLTLGAFDSFAGAEAAASLLNRQDLHLAGVATRIDIVRIVENRAENVAGIALSA